MDEFDFDPGADDFGGLGDDPGADGGQGDSSGFDEFEADAAPDGDEDLDGFAFDSGLDDDGLDDGGLTGDPGGDDGDGFAADAAYDDADGSGDEPGGDEAAYAATYEDLLLDEADNPPSFPPELDLDVPEPVDGHPWVDLDVLGHGEAEPWVNTVDAGEYALADVDDPAAQALARFWQG